tara:strand:+ start:1843 stop:1974 length:132 start_codon:yes stop_codon:yes gene_type:complete
MIKVLRMMVAIPIALLGFLIVALSTALVWAGAYIVSFAQWMGE